MKNSKSVFCILVCLVFVSYAAFAASYCLNCFDQIDEKRKILRGMQGEIVLSMN